MSRRASKSSMVGDQNDFYLDCKAAYLAVFDDIKDEIESKEDLVQVLQQAGRNPTSRALARYWSSNTDHLTFDDFMDICRKEKETKADDLLKAFRKIDLNGDGYISFDELYKIMNAGSDKMSRSEVKNIFDEVDENNDGRLDYGEFSKMVESTTAECKKWSKKVMEKKERKKRKDLLEKPRRGEGSIGSQTSLRSTASHKSDRRHGSTTSLSSQKKAESSDQHQGSTTSLSSQKKTESSELHQGSTTSLASQKKAESSEQQHLGSTTSLSSQKKAESNTERPSSASVRSTTSSKRELADESSGTKDEGAEKDKYEDKKILAASRTSLRSNRSGSIKPKSEKADEDASSIRASRTSLRSNKSAKSQKEAELPKEITASRFSVKSSHSKRGISPESVAEDIEESASDDSDDDDIIISSSRSSTAHKASHNSQTEAEPEVMTPKKRSSDGRMFGSFASVKSVGSRSLLSVAEPPVPTQRKSLLHSIRLDNDEEDLPKPSPRVKSAKGKTSTVSRQKLVEPSNLREWNHQTRKGMFFLEEEDNSIISHQFTLKLKESTKVWVTIQPTIYKSMAQKEGPVDTAVYIIRSKPDVKGNYLVAFSMHKDAKGRQGVKCDLEAGSYHIIPFTTGCHLKKRTVEPRNKQTLLVEKSGGGHTITSPFKAVLEEIFEMADIDANGLMCRDDFNWYNIRTNDDEVGDDEWGVVEEQLDLDDGEMTKKGFIQLNKLEAEESQGDEDDLWVTLESMGYNKNLKMDEAAPFQLDVYTEDSENAGLTVAGINPINPDSGTLLAEKAYKSVCQSVMEKGEKTKIKDMKDLHLYTYSGETRGTIIIENKSHSNVRVELDCSDSKNVITNQSSMEEMFTAKAKSQTIAYHFVPEDDSTDWSIRCTESIRK